VLTDLITQHLAQFAAEKTKTHEQTPRENTLRAHRLQLERFAHEYDQQFADLSGLTVNWCKDWVIHLAQRTGPANVNQALTALTGFLSYLADADLWDRDSLESWQRFQKRQYCRPRSRSSSIKYLRSERLEAILKGIAATPNRRQADRDVAFFGSILALARPGELILIQRRHIKYCPETGDSPRSFQILIPAEIAKDHSERIVEIFEGNIIGDVNIFGCFYSYAVWRTEHGPAAPDSPFFIGIRQNQQDGTSRRLWAKLFKRAAQRAGLPFVSAYWLRHSAGELGLGKLHPREMAQLFGHSDERTTEGYTNHRNEDRLREARLRLHAAILESLAS
jgi:site-specific recombinase XerD